MIRKKKKSSACNPRFDRTRSNMREARILPKHSPTKSHLRDKTDKKLILRDFLAGDRPTFATPLASPVLRVRLCLCLQFNYAIVATTPARFAQSKGHELLRFFFHDMG